MTSKKYNFLKNISKYLVTATTVGLLTSAGNNLYAQKKDTICSSIKDSKIWTQKYKRKVTGALKDSLLIQKNKNKSLESKVDSLKNINSKEKGKIMNIYNIDNSKKTINNFYGKEYFLPKKKSNIYFRTLFEANANIETQLLGARLSEQVRLNKGKNGNFWGGVYIEGNFGKDIEKLSEDVYNKTVLDESLDMNLESIGVRTSEMITKSSFGFGLVGSFDTKGKFSFDISTGLNKNEKQLTGIIEEGNDIVSLGGNTIDSKPYFFKKENQNKTSKFIPIARLGVNYNLTDNLGLGMTVNTKGKVKANITYKLGKKGKK